MRYLLTTILTCILVGAINGQSIFTSTGGGGNWNSASSWSENTQGNPADSDGIPDKDDDVIIASGDVININVTADCANLSIVGTINFSSNRRLKSIGSIVMSGTSAEVTGNNNSRILQANGDFTVSTGADADISGQTVLILGASTINGKLSFSNPTGTKTFDDLTIGTNGEWNVAVIEDFEINGNITNNGTFNGCENESDCEYDLTSATGTISGNNEISIPNLKIDDPGSYTNTGNLTITNTLSGTGELINGDDGTLDLQGEGAFSISTFDATTDSNEVIYTSSTSTDMINTTYHDLTINMSSGADVTLDGTITINNVLDFDGGDIILGNHNVIVGTSGSVTGFTSARYCKITGTGRFRKLINSIGSFDVPVGTSSDFGPINFTMQGGSFAAGAFVEFDFTPSAHPSRDVANTGSGGDDTGVAATSYLERYWTLSGTGITSPKFDVEIEYDDGDVVGTESLLTPVLYRSITIGMNTFDDWLSRGTVDPVANIINFHGGDNFGDISCIDNEGSRLPIVLMSFDAEVVNEGVKLDWVTATEIDNELFTIERSTNGYDFEEILYREGAGDSYEVRKYSMIDRNPIVGQKAYYRLKQTDFSGAFDYSEIKSVVFNRSEPLVSIYPNPISPNDQLKIKINSGTKYIQIIDLQGNILNQINQFESNSQEVSVHWKPQWPAGVYVVRIGSDLGIENKKLLVK